MKSLSKKIISLIFLAFMSQGLFAKGSNALALGSVLPERVARANIVTGFAKIDSKFNSKGEKESLGMSTNLGITAAALEYGLTSKLSLQVLVPFVFSNEMTYEPSELVESSTFALLESKSPINDRAQNAALFLGYFDQAKHGKTGLADIEVGARYNWLTNDFFVFSTGLGVRLPTGEHYAAKLLRPIGSGFYTGAIRNNLDFALLEKNLWFSLEHQAEFALSRSVKGVEDQSNILALDDSKKKPSFQSGLTHKAKVQTSFSFEALTDHLKFLSTAVSYNFASEASVYVGGEKSNPRSYLHAVNGNISLSALPYKIPVSLDLDYTKPFAGKNSRGDKESLTLKLKAYLKI